MAGVASHEQRRVVSTLITRIEIGDKSVALHVVPAKLRTMLQRDSTGNRQSDGTEGERVETVIVSVAAQLQRVGKGGRLIWAPTYKAQPVLMPR